MSDIENKKFVPRTKVIGSGLRKDAKIWRYMDLSKFLDLIENNYLFFSRADKFEDRFEGSFTPGTKKLIEQAYESMDTSYSYGMFKEELKKHTYINCWHKNVNDSIAMWKIYGGSINSIAIISDIESIANQMPNHEWFGDSFNKIDQVKYLNHWKDPEISIRPYVNVFFYKLKAYQFEQEIRAIIDTSHTHFGREPIDDHGIKVPVNIKEIVKEIVVAPNAPSWFYDLVNKLVNERYNLSVNVRWSRLAQEAI